MINIIDELFNKNRELINTNTTKIDNLENRQVSSFTYSFISSTLAEAQSFSPVNFEVRFITNARKSGEGAGLGTGLPAFYDSSSGDWLDFTGNIIQV